MGGISAVRVTAAVCTAQVLAQLGAFTFFALLPAVFTEWDLGHSEAGILNGVVFGAYAIAVPFLVPLTARIYVCAVALTSFSHLGMAVIAEGFWGGLVFRILAGIGWGGTYMVGLKALADLVEGPTQSRAVAFHAASVGIGGSLSFLLSGWAAGSLGWQGVFQIAAAGSILALVVMACLVPARNPVPREGNGGISSLMRALRNRSAISYSIGYCVHTWEMFTLRSWVVTFLVFTAAQGEGPPSFMAPTIVAMLMELTGTAASVIGNEAAIRFGRRRWILAVMVASTAAGAMVGFSAGLGYGIAAAACIVYSILIYADSAALTAGAVGAAEQGHRGATLAVHGMMGFGGGFFGPLLLGTSLGLLGGETVANWGVAFAHVSVVMVIGILAVRLLGSDEPPDDKP